MAVFRWVFEVQRKRRQLEPWTYVCDDLEIATDYAAGLMCDRDVISFRVRRIKRITRWDVAYPHQKAEKEGDA